MAIWSSEKRPRDGEKLFGGGVKGRRCLMWTIIAVIFQASTCRKGIHFGLFQITMVYSKKWYDSASKLWATKWIVIIWTSNPSLIRFRFLDFAGNTTLGLPCRAWSRPSAEVWTRGLKEWWGFNVAFQSPFQQSANGVNIHLIYGSICGTARKGGGGKWSEVGWLVDWYSFLTLAIYVLYVLDE